jgi:MFS superfamily sulfate permease-like transporter
VGLLNRSDGFIAFLLEFVTFLFEFLAALAIGIVCSLSCLGHQQSTTQGKHRPMPTHTNRYTGLSAVI